MLRCLLLFVATAAANQWLNSSRLLQSALPVSYYPSSSYPSGFTLAKSNLVGTVALPAQYVVSFDMYPTATGTAWRNIIHLTATGTDIEAGSRLPCVNFCANGICDVLGLEVYHMGTSIGDQLLSSALPLNAWSTVTILMDSVNLMMTLTVTGAVTIPTMTKSFGTPVQQTWPSVQVYASNPWIDTASANIRSLAIVLPDTTTPTAIPTSTPTAFASPITFNYVGHEQIFVVPPEVTSITVSACGAKGGNDGTGVGGLGGFITSELPVIPGKLLYVYVGGSGLSTTSPLGYNGGGSGYSCWGGGSTDIRSLSGGSDGSVNVTSRLIVAGGGGGGGGGFCNGGAGGGLVGASGEYCQSGTAGTGGTQHAGGSGGNCYGGTGIGALWSGGNCPSGYRGGGGGYYGGGGGDNGGGGSSFTVPAGKIVVNNQGDYLSGGCLACPVNSQSEGGASTNCYCNAGYYASQATLTTGTCTQASAGKYLVTTSGGSTSCATSGTSTNCLGTTLCAAGTYTSSAGQSSCAICGEGFVTDSLTAAGAITCTPCPPGTFTASSQVACQTTTSPTPSPTFNLLAPTSVGQIINVGTAANPAFRYPVASTIDKNGFMYVADTSNNLIRRIDLASGAVTSVGSSASPPFNSPQGVSVDSAGKLLYVADRGNSLVRLIDLTTGQVTSVGTSASPAFDSPVGVCVDSAGKYLYVGDTSNGLVRRVDLTSGQVINLGTSASPAYSSPTGVSVDGLGKFLYVADWFNNLIRRIDLNSGVVTNVGTSASPAFSHPIGVVVDNGGQHLYVADQSTNLVRCVDLFSTNVTNVGTSASPAFVQPSGVALYGGEYLYVMDAGNNLVRRITLSLPSPTPLPTYVFLGPTSVGQVIDVGASSSPPFKEPSGLALDKSGRYLYVGDTFNNLLRRVDLITGFVTSFGTLARPGFYLPDSIALDSSGQLLYVADSHNNLVRRVNLTSGAVTNVSTSAVFKTPKGIALDSTGHLYVADTGNGLVRRVNLASEAVINVGTSAVPAFNAPRALALDSMDRYLYVADEMNSLVRSIDLSSGEVRNVTTLANPAFKFPRGLAIDKSNKYLFVSDSGNNLVRRVDLTSGGVTSLGTSASPAFSTPAALVLESSGQYMYVADQGNWLVRRITMAFIAAPTPFPTDLPSPTTAPSPRPSAAPTQPSARPTLSPTYLLYMPTPAPSPKPSQSPSALPTTTPTLAPTAHPTSSRPSSYPSPNPTSAPTTAPIANPTSAPSPLPTVFPTPAPTQPTAMPTAGPTAPTFSPTPKPSAEPTANPTPLPSAEPSAVPTPQPSALPSPQPSRSPTALPTHPPSSEPTPQPSSVPSTRPSPAPSVRPTTAPSPRPSPLPTHAPTGQPSSRPSSRPTFKPTKHCGPGTYIGSRGLECLPCSPGTFSSFFGAISCLLCPPGSFSTTQSQQCTLCPKTSYQPDSGSDRCLVCPAGRLTPFDGATTESACLSPLNNFILGSVALGFAAVLVCLYVIYGRFRFASYIRRERVVMQQVKEYKRVMFELLSFEDDVAFELGELKADETIKRIFSKKQQRSSTLYVAAKDLFGILVFTFLCVTLGTIAVVLCFAFIIMRVFFNSLIIWKQSNNFMNLVDYRSAILQVADALSELFADWNFPPIVVRMVRALLLLLQKLFDLLARFKIDLSAMNVTCQGSKDPFILLENLFVLGCVIIVIESQMQVFRGLVFTTTLEKHNSILLSREYRMHMLSRDKSDASSLDRAKWFASYALELLQLLVVQVLAQVFDFKTVLQFAVAQVEFSAFVSSPTHTMASTEACNQVPGAKNFDYFLATVTSGLAFAVVLPTIYEVAKVCCPNDPVAILEAIDKKKKTTEGSDEVKKKQGTRPDPLNFWSYLRMPLTFFAPDLLLAHYTHGLVWLLKNSINANQARESDKDRPPAVKQTRRQSLVSGIPASGNSDALSNTDNPMLKSNGQGVEDLSFVKSLDSSQTTPQKCVAGLRRYYLYSLRTLHPFRARSAEADRWREMMDKDRLPSYWDLLRIEAHVLFSTSMPKLGEKLSSGYFMSVLAACLLAVVPVGHLTYPGRKAVLEVGNRFFYFFMALFGRWNKDVVAAYDIIGQVERMAVDSIVENSKDRNRVNLRYSQVIDATIAPRAILLQLVPWLTIWSVFSIATSRCAMWVRGESGLLGRKLSTGKRKHKEKKKNKKESRAAEEEEQQPQEEEAQDFVKADEEAKVFPWLISFDDAFERAKHEDNGRWKKRRWVTYISALRIIVLYSRAIQYIISAYMTFISVWVLFHPANKAVLASIVLVLLPLAIAQGLGVVLVIGKALNVKDLIDVGNPGETEKKVIKFKGEDKTKEEVKALLVEKLKKKKRKLRSLTAAEDEDDFDVDALRGEAAGDDEFNEDDCKCCFRSDTSLRQQKRENRIEHNQVEMTTHRHRPHQSIAEAILPARSSIIPRDSIGPEMAPLRLSFDGVDPHRPSILALSNHHHVLQAHGHLNALHQQQRLSPDQTDHAPSGPGSAAATAEVPAGQRLHIQHGHLKIRHQQHQQLEPQHQPRPTDHSASAATSNPLATSFHHSASPTAPLGSRLQSLARLPPSDTGIRAAGDAPRRIKISAPTTSPTRSPDAPRPHLPHT